jgi:NADH-quinone oxidoreductase subunit C/D
MVETPSITEELQARFGGAILAVQPTRDAIPTVWIGPDRVKAVLGHLKSEIARPYPMLFDLTAHDERERRRRDGLPPADFTLVYHLLSLDRAGDLRVKVPLIGDNPAMASVTDLWPSANWYEREVWDMFGIVFTGHPRLVRILMPPWWKGHPLRKEHPARATELEPFRLSSDESGRLEEELAFNPEAWGLQREGAEGDYLFLNVGPQHPGTHGPLRVILQLEGQTIVDAVCDIGYHHRGAEKMGERQSWHSFIPYTDRIDYLGGVLNNLPYVMAVEKLAGIEVPDKARVIRVLMCELYRIISHLVYYGTFAQDTGAMSPVFYMFNDRERAFDVAEAVTGARMHPAWFRIGGTAMDLPRGWESRVRDFLDYLPARLRDYDRLVLNNRLFKARTVGVGELAAAQAVAWGATGPMLRASGVPWDLRKVRPYSGYDRFEFDVPTGRRGDCHDRAAVHVEEMRQSLRIIGQCVRNMPAGPWQADHPLAVPPRKDRTLEDIETLIHHFLAVSWGPVIPAGEAAAVVEGAKGCTSYYLVSDGGVMSYRTRIRTPSFAHLQLAPKLVRGRSIPDLAAVLGSIDFVLADVDR